MKSLEYKTELALVKSQSVDVTDFENNLETFKTAFAKNYDLASRRFQTAIDEIDKSITHLQKTKDALIGTDWNGSEPSSCKRQVTGCNDQEANPRKPNDGFQVRRG